MAGRVTLVLPAVQRPEAATPTPLGRLTVPGRAIPKKTVSIDPEDVTRLRDAARDVATRAHAPYSRFRVGAALIMADDRERRVIAGANVENASYGGTICAERTALTQAASLGFRRLELLVVSCVATLDAPLSDRSPCGICRQVIHEFGSRDPETLVIVDSGGEGALGDVFDLDRLLPYGFSLSI
ncbi:MAG: cytidine deaminase [Thalassobaculaceae bacterium]